jgi:hypothetical protein
MNSNLRPRSVVIGGFHRITRKSRVVIKERPATQHPGVFPSCTRTSFVSLSFSLPYALKIPIGALKMAPRYPRTATTEPELLPAHSGGHILIPQLPTHSFFSWTLGRGTVVSSDVFLSRPPCIQCEKSTVLENLACCRVPEPFCCW